MNYKRQIVDAGLKMFEGGYTVETWGNISVRDIETNLVYLTPSGMDYSTITEEDVVVVDIDGKVVEGNRKPTIETGLHLAIYKNRPEVNAVVHTHPIHSTVFSCCGEDIPQVTDEASQIMGGPCITADYALPGSPELADNCVKALGKKNNTCLLKSHGAVCLGADMTSAFRVCKVLEITAEIYQKIRAMGKDYHPISQENIDAMEYFVKNIYGQR